MQCWICRLTQLVFTFWTIIFRNNVKILKKVSMRAMISGCTFITFLQQKYITWVVLTWSLYSETKSWHHIKTRNSIEFVGKSKNRIFCKYRCRDEFGFSSRISSYEYIYFNALKVYVSISILACFIAPNLVQYGVWHTWKAIQRFNVPVLAGTHKKYQVEYMLFRLP